LFAIELDINIALILFSINIRKTINRNHTAPHTMPRQGDGSSDNAIPKDLNNIIHGAGEEKVILLCTPITVTAIVR
jgi:hypothetical protein